MAIRDSARPTISIDRRQWLLHAAGVASFALPVRSIGADSPAAGSFAAAELKRAAERAELCSTSNATGTGLRGEYFSRDRKTAASLLVRVDATVDFDAGFDWPAALGGRRPGSARWTGWLKPPYSGAYRFHADEGSTRIIVARETLVDKSVASGSKIELAAGRYYPISMESVSLDDLTGRLKLEWTAPHGARYVVPRALLFPPTDTRS